MLRLISRFASFFGGPDSKSTPRAGAGPWSVPDGSLPLNNSTPNCHESSPPICESRSENSIVESSEGAAISTPGKQDSLSPRVQQLSNSSVAPEPRSVYSSTVSFLAGASGFRLGDIQYIDASHATVHTGGSAADGSRDGWELLLKNIAPNALHDSRARYDAPKCDEDTRVEVTGEIMDWIQDRSAPQRLLCMTGAAGAGKSALQQTVAERCAKSDILGAAFFFSSVDPTRNRASSVVGTIAYQLGLKHPLFQSSIVAAVKRDPLIFTRSIQSQMEGLIVLPFKNLRMSTVINIDTFPYAILIDGLDECKGEPNDTATQGEDRQAELLAVIRLCILNTDLPFRVFISSRPEWAVRTALEPGGHLHQVAYCIQLSDKYDASGDMYRYLRRRFEYISLQISDPQWFSEDNINTLVEAASGQFIYVATVYKYISERRASPAERLKIILTWTPDECQRTRPFEALDRLYAIILSTAKNAYEAVDTHHGRDFLLLFKAHHLCTTGLQFGPTIIIHPPPDLLSALLSLEARAEESLISDLRSLVTLEKDEYGRLRLRLYHKSFSDFLEAESRAQALFVPKSRALTHLAKCCMRRIIECPLDFASLPDKWNKLPLPVLYRRSLIEAVDDLPLFLTSAPAIDDEVFCFTQNDGWQKLSNLLPLLYRSEGWLFGNFDKWISHLAEFSHELKTRQPEAAATISEFVEKWKSEKTEWR